MDPKEEKQEDYFRRPALFHMIWVPIGMGVLTLSFLNHELLPLAYMGSIGRLCSTLANYLPTTLKIIKYEISSRTTIKWMVQTLAFGYFSLVHLVNYDPEETKKKQS